MKPREDVCSIYPRSIVEPRNSFCSIYPSNIVESRKADFSIYPTSIVEGQHMYRQEEDGLTPGQLKRRIRTHYNRTIEGHLR